MILPSGPHGLWPVDARLAECPTWLPGEDRLAWVDILEPSYNLLDPATGRVERRVMPGKIGSAAPRDGASAIVALESGLWDSRPGDPPRGLASPDMTGIHFNDGKCDPAGRFWVGSRASDGSAGGGALFRYDPDGTVHPIADGFDVPNGLGWSADGTAFFLIDTVPRLLYRYDFDLSAGTIAHRRVVCRFEDLPGKPDGLAIDTQDRIWCAMWDGRGIAVLSFAGDLLGWLPTPCQRPTSCAFGGDDGRTLFVTTASHQLDPCDPAFGEAGSILAFRVEEPGVPVALFGAAPVGWR
ncbi:SMP-30/gluconolactonase/LRE family protein [Novosphingobium sp.]|uniref:SMP-30/gluconolactonase/LRE family protein n=1 Tax=Novosphingobium sp. TaxID=1874826 RepID=UPI002613D6A3|nr:SMP-30/gluconolactonase/LRE family protein [Novosphingobium sp.]